MQYRHLGRSGLVVSRIALGSASFGAVEGQPWRSGPKDVKALVRAAIERGINFFDTGPTYGKSEAETLLGNALREVASRSSIVLATKVYFPTGPGPNDRGLSRRHIFASVDASLKRLGVDDIDLLLIHRWDPHTPLEETLRALDDLVTSGKVRYLGASSMSAWRFMKALAAQRAAGFAPFIAMQSYYNLIYREEEREMLALCREEGVGVTPWSPLARGLLAGAAVDPERVRDDALVGARFAEGPDRPVIERLHEVAAARGVPVATVALSWLLSQPTVVAPIIGFSQVSQIDVACDALDLELTAQEIHSLEERYVPHPVIGHADETDRG